eukprot:jgi/Psemu1/3299/gm1.3299_g
MRSLSFKLSSGVDFVDGHLQQKLSDDCLPLVLLKIANAAASASVTWSSLVYRALGGVIGTAGVKPRASTGAATCGRDPKEVPEDSGPNDRDLNGSIPLDGDNDPSRSNSDNNKEGGAPVKQAVLLNKFASLKTSYTSWLTSNFEIAQVPQAIALAIPQLTPNKELSEWAIKLERLNLFSWMKGNPMQMRSRVMKGIYGTVPEIEGDGFEPLLIDWCYKKSIFAEVTGCKQIYIQSFQKALHLLLTNVTLVKEEDLSFPHAEDPTLPVCYPELQGNIDIDELHHGQWWIDTWEKRCSKDRIEILMHGRLYTRDKGGESIDNVNNLHSGLRAALSSLKDACHLTDVTYFIGDTPQHNQLCGIIKQALGNNARVNVLKVPVSIESGKMKMSKDNNGEEYHSVHIWKMFNFTAPMVEEGVNVELHIHQLGRANRAAETFCEDFLGNNTWLRGEMDQITSYYGAAVQRQSDHDFPRTNLFGNNRYNKEEGEPVHWHALHSDACTSVHCVTQTRFRVISESRAYLGRTPLVYCVRCYRDSPLITTGYGKQKVTKKKKPPLFTARRRKKAGVIVSPGLLNHISHDFASSLFIRKSRKKLEDATQQLGLTSTCNGPQSSDGALPEVLDNQVMYDPSVEPIGRALIGRELTNIEDDNDSVSDDNFFFPNADDEEEGSVSIEAPHSLIVNDEEGNNIDVDDSHCDSSTLVITTPNVGRNISDELKVKIKFVLPLSEFLMVNKDAVADTEVVDELLKIAVAVADDVSNHADADANGSIVPVGGCCFRFAF